MPIIASCILLLIVLAIVFIYLGDKYFSKIGSKTKNYIDSYDEEGDDN